MRSDTTPRIPLSAPEIAGNESMYVQDALATGWVSSAGPYVGRFETIMARHLGVSESVAVASGTAALHLALAALGIGDEDEVLVPSLTFIAPANAVRYVGARPVFIDVAPGTWQMDPDLVRAFLEDHCARGTGGLRNKVSGRRVSAILVVHTLGLAADLEPILQCAAEFSIPVVEDASESLGTRSRGSFVGTLGSVGCFSFNGNKLITTGAGGLVVSPSPEILGRVRYLSTQARDAHDEYVHGSVGFNYRMSNVHAALGTAQAERLPDFVSSKRRIARRYCDGLHPARGLSVMPGVLAPEVVPWLVSITVDPAVSRAGSRDLIQRLGREGVEARPLWQPMHRSAAHAGSESVGGRVADGLYERGVSLPSSVSLTDDQVDHVCSIVRAAADGA